MIKQLCGVGIVALAASAASAQAPVARGRGSAPGDYGIERTPHGTTRFTVVMGDERTQASGTLTASTIGPSIW